VSGPNRLFNLAPETFIVQAHHVAGEGWRLLISMRRQDEPWPDARRDVYDHLTTEELVDVILATTSQALLDL